MFYQTILLRSLSVCILLHLALRSTADFHRAEQVSAMSKTRKDADKAADRAVGEAKSAYKAAAKAAEQAEKAFQSATNAVAAAEGVQEVIDKSSNWHGVQNPKDIFQNSGNLF